MKKIKRILLLQSVGESLSESDLISQQRFRLFRITTVFSLAAYIAMLFQVMVVLSSDAPEIKIISVLFLCLFANYFGLIIHKKPLYAYTFLVLILFTLLHLITYTSGGIRNSGMFYLAGMIFITYMLLGSKGGKVMSLISVMHIVYFYFVSRYTDWISYTSVGTNAADIDIDFLVTGIISVLVLTSQSNYLEKSKNAIIADILSKKNELAIKNIALEKTIEELDTFGYVVSHDLKAPLRAIGNLTGWIEEDMGVNMPADVKINFTTIKERVERMEALINGILAYSKAGKDKGMRETVNSEELLKEAFELIGAPDNCSVNIEPGMPVLFTDKIKLLQTFMNIINNGIKYNDKEYIYINATVAEEKNFWHFTITDNGPGIEQQFHDKIFVLFQTLNARDDIESTGVGLTIVKKIVEDKGGKIWLKSEMGQNTAFHFTWPKIEL